MNIGIVNFLNNMSKTELIHMVIRLHEMNLQVKALLSDMTWIETGVEE